MRCRLYGQRHAGEFDACSAEINLEVVLCIGRSPLAVGQSVHQCEKYGYTVVLGVIYFVFINR